MDSSQFTDKALEIITNAQQLCKQNSNPEMVPLHFLAAMTPSNVIGEDKQAENVYLKSIIEGARFDWTPFERTVNRHLVRLPSVQGSNAQPTMSGSCLLYTSPSPRD